MMGNVFEISRALLVLNLFFLQFSDVLLSHSCASLGANVGFSHFSINLSGKIRKCSFNELSWQTVQFLQSSSSQNLHTVSIRNLHASLDKMILRYTDNCVTLIVILSYFNITQFYISVIRELFRIHYLVSTAWPAGNVPAVDLGS